MLANALPIYCGNPEVHCDFNEKSFINCHRFEDLDAVVERVIEIDQDDELYLSYMSKPYLKEGGYLEGLSERALIEFFNRVFRIEK